MIVAVLDACVLYPPSLRDLLIRIAVSSMYEPRWTAAIQAEWVRNVLLDNPTVARTQLERTCELMDQFNPTGMVSGYEEHIESVTLPDPDDRHVLAAAIQASASHVVTFNLSDFPDSVTGPHNIEAIHPDLFLTALFDRQPEQFLSAVQKHRSALRNPAKTPQDYIDTLNTNSLTELAIRIGANRDMI